MRSCVHVVGGLAAYSTLHGGEFCWPNEVFPAIAHILTITKLEGLGDLGWGDGQSVPLSIK